MVRSSNLFHWSPGSAVTVRALTRLRPSGPERLQLGRSDPSSGLAPMGASEGRREGRRTAAGPAGKKTFFQRKWPRHPLTFSVFQSPSDHRPQPSLWVGPGDTHLTLQFRPRIGTPGALGGGDYSHPSAMTLLNATSGQERDFLIPKLLST